MGKDQKKTQPKGGKQQKSQKLPEIEDFFTNFLSKKLRNINKKVQHIDDLEKKKKTGTELKQDQLDLISRREELNKQIEEINAIKTIYFEAYSKKSEYEVVKKEDTPQGAVEEKKVEVEQVEAPVEAKPEVPQIDVAAITESAEKKGVSKACGSISKLFLTSHLLRNAEFCDQFNQASNINDLEVLSTFNNELFVENGDNFNQTINIQNKLEEYVNQVDVRGVDNKSLPEINNLVEVIVNNENFTTFVPVTPEPVPEPVKEEPIVEAQEVRKNSEIPTSKSRKESEQQQDFFMEDDSEDEEEKKVEVKETVETKVVEQEIQPEKLPLQDKEQNSGEDNVKKANKKEEPKKKSDGDDDEDEWHSVPGKNTHHYNNRPGTYRGDRRGNNRGGRGGYQKRREGDKREFKDGEKREYKDGEKREFKDGEGKPRRHWNKDGENYKRGDGENYKRGDGENYKRGDRENKGGRGGRGGNRRWNKDGDRKPYHNKGAENERPTQDGEGKQLKEVGTLDKPQEKVAPVETQVQTAE